MVALRSRRLEGLFGCALDVLAAANIRGLVEAGAQEAFDLDFKAEMYGRSDAAKRDLAGDVAALANTAGGVIVIGVAEDDQARATGTPGIDIGDSEVERILQVVSSLVSPMPVFDVIPVVDLVAAGGLEPVATQSDDPDLTRHGFLVIAVPRSPSGPHAVLVNESLRYPKRNGSTTRYLSEPEVATAYRDRLAGFVKVGERVAAIEAEAIARLSRDGDPWLLVSLVPDLPGELSITDPVFIAFRQEILGRTPGLGISWTAFSRARVGRRRLLADGTADNDPLANWVSIELGTDGGGAMALHLWNLNDSRQRSVSDTDPQHLISDESLALGVLSGLVELAQHASERAAAGGNAIVRARLVHRAETTIGVGHMRQDFVTERGRSTVASALEITDAAEAVVALDELAQIGPALVAAAAMLIDEIGQSFSLAEMGQLTRVGEVFVPYWSHSTRQVIAAWARSHDIPIKDLGTQSWTHNGTSAMS